MHQDFFKGGKKDPLIDILMIFSKGKFGMLWIGSYKSIFIIIIKVVSFYKFPKSITIGHLMQLIMIKKCRYSIEITA